MTAKVFTRSTKATFKNNVFPSIQQQQQLHNGTCFSQPLYLKKIKQYGPSSSNEEGERRLDEAIPQDVKRDQSNDRCSEDVKRYEENSRRNEYDSHGDRRDNPDGQYQQSDNERYEHYTNSRRSSVFDTK